MAKFDPKELSKMLLEDTEDTDDNNLDGDFKQALSGDTSTPKAKSKTTLDESDEDGEDDEDDSADEMDEEEDLEEEQEDEESDAESEEDEPDEEDDPDFDPDTSKKQSADKKNPANKAFAALNRDLKSLKATNRQFETELGYINSEFARIAEKAGYKGIKSAREFVDAMSEQNAMAEYNRTKDPQILVDITEKRIERKNNPGVQADAMEISKKQVALEMQKQMDDLNSEYGTNLKDVDEIAKLPNARRIIERMAKGDSLSDAYLLANKDTVLKNKTNAAKQKALNNAKGHSHVKSNAKPEGINGNRVSEQEIDESIDLWSALFPGKTKSQYRSMMQKEKNMDS